MVTKDFEYFLSVNNKFGPVMSQRLRFALLHKNGKDQVFIDKYTTM